MSDAGAAQAGSGTAQLLPADDYAKYIREEIVVGRTVRCRRCYEKVHETDIGTVTKLDKDGLHDLNVQVHWHKAGCTYWVRYVHVELLEEFGVHIGEQVRVRRSVVRPKYGWGSVNHDSVGKVTGLSSDGDVIVHFPEKRGWKALMSELEPATAERREEAVRKKIVVGDQVRVKRSVDEPRFKWGNVTHGSVGKVTDISNRPEGQVVIIDFRERKGWKGLLSEMELAIGERREEAVRKKIGVGDKVRVKRSVQKPRYEWGNVSHGSIGKVTKVASDGDVTIDFPEQKGWEGVPSEMELVTTEDREESVRALAIGDKVRVKRIVKKPRFEWGGVTHESVGKVTEVTSGGHIVTVDFPERSEGWKGMMSEMELASSDGDEGNCAFCSHSLARDAEPLVSADDYAKYIREKIAVGLTVRCRRCYEKVHETDIGTVTKLDKDGLHDLNVQVHWHKTGTYWVRYVHVELLEDSGVHIGEQVRVRRSVVTPKYKWGNVNHDSVGKVTEVTSPGNVVTIDFPEHKGWKGLQSELELATAERREEAVRKEIMVGDIVRVKRSVEKPRYEWGNVTHNSVGKVTGLPGGGEIIVHFPEQRGWKGVVSEMELATLDCVFCSRDPVIGTASAGAVMSQVEHGLRALLEHIGISTQEEQSAGSEEQPSRSEDRQPETQPESAQTQTEPVQPGSNSAQEKVQSDSSLNILSVECQICLRPWGPLVRRAVILPCMHGLGCLDCLQRVFTTAVAGQAKCPFCRGPFSEPPKPIFL